MLTPSPCGLILLTGLPSRWPLWGTWLDLGDWLWKTTQSLPSRLPRIARTHALARHGGSEEFNDEPGSAKVGDILLSGEMALCASFRFSLAHNVQVCIVVPGKQTTFFVEADYETWGGGSQVDMV